MGSGRALTEPLPAGVLEIRSIRVGVVVLKAVHSGFYVAMNRLGRLYGSVSGSAQGGRGCAQKCAGVCSGACPGPLTAHPAAVLRCALQEENGYNTYASVRWRHQGRPMFLALDGRGAPRLGGRTQRHHPSTLFLPVLVS